MYPWRRILIPTDFSTASEWVFDDAVRIAAATGAEIVIMHNRVTRTSNPKELRFPADPSLYEYAEQHEMEVLQERVRRAHASVVTRLVIRQGPHPGEEILKTAEEQEADLIVIATHASHHVAHLIVGSTTLSILRKPICPILAIRYGIRKRQSMQRILVPIHVRQSTRAALDLAVAIARNENAELHLLTVCRDGERETASSTLQAAAEGIAGVRLQQHVAIATDVHREIVRYAEKHDADVVFLNATEEPSDGKIDLIRHLPAPVMIVP